jgi:quinol monooxygenase YgiN
MVRLTVSFPTQPRCAHDLLESLRFLMVGTRLEDGCIGCSTWVDSDSTIHYTEEWASEAAIRRRVRSDGFTSLLGVMETAKQAPRIHFDFVTTSRGLDYVAEVRGEPAG